MNRRRFLRRAGSGAFALAPAASLMALEADDPFRQSIGVQLYTLRHQLQDDVPGTLQAVAEAGYFQVETYGFPGCEPVIEAARAAGLEVRSSHFAWESVTEPDRQGVPAFSSILEQAAAQDLRHLVIPYLHGRNRKTLGDYQRVAERCNRAAVLAREAGIQLSYHNHAFEFEPLEAGRCGYDVLIEEFAPEMQFEVDVFWVKIGGLDPVDLLRRLDGRVDQLHLKDLEGGTAIPNYGKPPDEAFEELGDGIIPMEPVIAAAGEIGARICHVEQDQSPNPLASIAQSRRHLETL